MKICTNTLKITQQTIIVPPVLTCKENIWKWKADSHTRRTKFNLSECSIWQRRYISLLFKLHQLLQSVQSRKIEFFVLTEILLNFLFLSTLSSWGKNLFAFAFGRYGRAWLAHVQLERSLPSNHKISSSITGSAKIWTDLCDFLSRLS